MVFELNFAVVLERLKNNILGVIKTVITFISHIPWWAKIIIAALLAAIAILLAIWVWKNRDEWKHIVP